MRVGESTQQGVEDLFDGRPGELAHQWIQCPLVGPFHHEIGTPLQEPSFSGRLSGFGDLPIIIDLDHTRVIQGGHGANLLAKGESILRSPRSLRHQHFDSNGESSLSMDPKPNLAHPSFAEG
jgi:hypothetical protein